MALTNRGLLLLLLAAPIIAGATWIAALQWVALVYLLIVLLIMVVDWREAQSLQKRFDIDFPGNLLGYQARTNI